MNQMSQRDLQLHVKILGWLHIVSSALFLIIGGFVFMTLTGIGAVSGDPQAVAVLGIVGTFVGALLVLLGLPGLLAGYALLNRKVWGRYLAIVLGILNLVNFPVGTIIGAYTLYVLLQDGATEFFSAPPEAIQAHQPM